MQWSGNKQGQFQPVVCSMVVFFERCIMHSHRDEREFWNSSAYGLTVSSTGHIRNEVIFPRFFEMKCMQPILVGMSYTCLRHRFWPFIFTEKWLFFAKRRCFPKRPFWGTFLAPLFFWVISPTWRSQSFRCHMTVSELPSFVTWSSNLFLETGKECVAVLTML